MFEVEAPSRFRPAPPPSLRKAVVRHIRVACQATLLMALEKFASGFCISVATRLWPDHQIALTTGAVPESGTFR